MAATNGKSESFWRNPSVARVEVLLFLFLWLAYGAAINSDNLVKFNLQQIGVEAMVERHQFYLEGSSVPELQPLGDVFLYQGHKYAAKQPGQFMAGAVVYWPLRAFGLRYANNYLLTSALVTFLTASLVLAASAFAVFRIARKLTQNTQSLSWPLLTAAAYAFGTTVFAYSGIAHHDALATGYLVIAFYLIFDLPRGGWDGRQAVIQSAGAGLLLGLAVTTSMLVFFMVIVCATYFLSLRRWKLIPFFLPALVIGLLPLLFYDARSFGNPFLLPNVAGNYADTYFHFSPNNLGNKLAFYGRALISYAPIFLLGLFGLSYLPRACKRESYFLALAAMILVLAVYVFNIDTDGAYQFGPRYLLPAMPFAALGIVGYSYLSKASELRFAAIMVVFVGMISFIINLVGALQGAMCCPDGRNVFLSHLETIGRGELHSHPLAPWLVIPLAFCGALLLLTTWALHTGKRSTKSHEAH